jgi:hypothetical protein
LIKVPHHVGVQSEVVWKTSHCRIENIRKLGFQVDNKDEVLAYKERLKKEGFFAREEMDTTYCYAVQDKFWITDPDENEWKFFYTKEDAEVDFEQPDTCCAITRSVASKLYCDA